MAERMVVSQVRLLRRSRMACHGKVGSARPGLARQSSARQGHPHTDVRGMAGKGSARRGKTGFGAVRFRSAVLGEARGRGDGHRSGSTPDHRTHGLGSAGTGMDRHGAAWCGMAWRAWAGPGSARHGREPQTGERHEHTIHTVT